MASQAIGGLWSVSSGRQKAANLQNRSRYAISPKTLAAYCFLLTAYCFVPAGRIFANNGGSGHRIARLQDGNGLASEITHLRPRETPTGQHDQQRETAKGRRLGRAVRRGRKLDVTWGR